MIGVLVGFAIIAAIISTGWLLGRLRVFDSDAEATLNRLAFFVLSPTLLFETLAQANLSTIFGRDLPVAAIAASSVIAIGLVLSLVAFRRHLPEAVIAALGAGYSNSNNIGIPVSVYVLGNATASAPIIMLQFCVIAPIALTVLDVTTGGRTTPWRIVRQPLMNPLIVGSLLGLVVALTRWKLPDALLAPFELVGGAAVPVILLGFGMSLAHSRVLDAVGNRKDIIAASVLKLVVMPVIAWATAYWGFGMRGTTLFAAVALAALPTAQNVYNYARRYDRAVAVARDIVFVTTIASVVALVVIAWLLAE
ncbi:MAG TPA: AEC family transporter [Galbitalea sp.]|jgi:hypothetical protein